MGPSKKFEFPLCKHEMICLRTGKYKDPPISHRFLKKKMANFHLLMKKKGCKLLKGFFLEKSENLTHLEEKKKVLELAILRA